jgi:hypothetical protein
LVKVTAIKWRESKYDEVFIKDSASRIAFYINRDEPILVSTLEGMFSDICNLMKTVTRMWQEPDSRKLFKSDKNVSVT